MSPHPLQATLDRVTVALYTSTDLMEIAQTRKAPNGRSDARQASLYRATVASCVGTLEWFDNQRRPRDLMGAELETLSQEITDADPRWNR
jgi:hypothetical protein